MPMIKLRGGIAYEAGGGVQIILPRLPISGIHIAHRAGAFIGGSTPALVANAVIKAIKISVNGTIQEEWDGENVSGVITVGMKMLKEYNRLSRKIAQTAEYFVRDLPDALPNGLVTIDIDFRALAECTTGSPTAMASTFDVYAVVKDKFPNVVKVAKVSHGKWKLGTSEDKTFYVKGIASGYVGKVLLIAVDDSATFSNAKCTEIEIKIGSDVFYTKHFLDIRQENTNKYGIAPSTGMALIELGNRQFQSDECAIRVRAASGATDTNIHWMLMQGALAK